MAVLCPRCGEYSSIVDEHCKKCGFSIKNFLDNQKRFSQEVTVENEINGSSSICLKEKESIDNEGKIDSSTKSDDIQENIMRLLSNIKIVPSEEKDNENETIDKNLQSVLEDALEDSLEAVSNNKSDEQKEEKVNQRKENALAKKEPVKIIAKKVADDVIILPPNRVKVEIEAAKKIKTTEEVHKTEETKKAELSDEVVEDKIKKIKEELVQNKEFIDKLEDMGMKEEENIELSEDCKKCEDDSTKDEVNEVDNIEDEIRKAREAEIHARAIPCTDGYTFREFLKESRENNISKKVTLIVGGVILLLFIIIMLITSSATAATL